MILLITKVPEFYLTGKDQAAGCEKSYIFPGALTAVRNHRTGKVSALDDTEAMKCVCPLF
ncbi:hypothetical protein Mal35_18830 [Gimesia maris]|nr:hypothetical protein Mal35_18830 [Gimesia maris]|tara:strand:- start:6182 stop:6361 length:180 start_codon:yes stop_codon:yes gene_type:complete